MRDVCKQIECLATVLCLAPKVDLRLRMLHASFEAQRLHARQAHPKLVLRLMGSKQLFLRFIYRQEIVLRSGNS
jgi:hypothetical protein